MRKSAFTLIELSIVLVIIGLIVGGSFKILQSMQESAKINTAKSDVEAARNVVMGYAMSTNHLPSKSFFTSDLSPVKANQHPLLYVHDTLLETVNICSFADTKLRVQVDENNGTSRIIPNIAFTITSEAANANLQTKVKPSGGGYYTLEVRKPYEKIDDEPNPINRVEEYDDITTWVTLQELQEKLNCRENGFRILNDNNLLDGDQNTTYPKAEIYTEGGTPFATGGKYKWCAQTSVPPAWLEVNCDGVTSSLETNCATASYKQCNSFIIEGKAGTYPSPAGIYKIQVHVQDQALSDRNKTFLIKIN